MPVENEKPWLQQSDEGDRHYEFFEFYLSLPPKERKMQKIANHFALSRNYISGISNRYEWPQRAVAWKNYLVEKAAVAAIQAAQDAVFDWWSWEAANRDGVRRITEGMLSKALKMIELPLTKTETKRRPIRDAKGKHMRGADGKPLYQEVTIITPVRFSLADLPRYATAIVELSRYLATQGGIRQLAASLPSPEKSVEEMTIEERAKWIAELRRRREAIVNGEPIDGGEQ